MYGGIGVLTILRALGPVMVGSFATLLIITGPAALGWHLAGFGSRGPGETRTRVLLAGVYGLFLLILGGRVLVATVGFSLPGATLTSLFLICLAIVIGGGAQSQMRSVLAVVERARSASSSAWRRLSMWERVVAVTAFSLVMGRLLWGAAMPPISYDSLQYHLVKAAKWIQGNHESLPDRFLEYFPDNGEVVWAWAMLPFRSDCLIAPAGALIWSLFLGAAYAMFRECGTRRAESALAALAVATVPAVVKEISGGMVDTIATAAITAAVALGTRSWKTRDASLLVGSSCAAGVAAGVKATMIPLAVGVGLACAAIALRLGGRSLRSLCVGACAFTLGALPYLRSYLANGSPLWPVGLELGPLHLKGDPALHALYSINGSAQSVRGGLLESLFWPGLPPRGGNGEYVNLGLGAAVLLLGVATALVFRRHRGEFEWKAAVLATMMLGLGVLPVIASEGALIASRWPMYAGRFLVAALVGAVGLGLSVGRMGLGVLGIAIVGNIASGWPTLFGKYDSVLVISIAGAFLGAMAICAASVCSALRGKGGRAIALTTVAWGATTLWLTAREGARHDLWEQAARAQTADFSVWPEDLPYGLWHRLDSPETKRVCVEGRSAALRLQYPLMGSRLQNVVYFPVGRIPQARSGCDVFVKGEESLMGAKW